MLLSKNSTPLTMADFELSKRLFTIAGLVDKNSKVADIGCDHGYLGIYLIQSGRAKSVIASDIKEGPLRTARDNIARCGCKGISLRLGNGLAPVGADEVDCVIIAGMGGEVISGIIDKTPWLRSDKYTLILQPMTCSFQLRKYLAENGFSIVSETAVKEKKVYTVIKAVYTGEKRVADNVFCAFGKLDRNDSVAAQLVEKVKRDAQKCLDEVQSVENMDEKIGILREIIEG